jgi:uncharacterized protein YbaR (Trm112 family)
LKKDIIDILCCPTCKGELKLTIEKEEKDVIIKGIFNCNKCKCSYIIKEGIPTLLPK